MPKPRPLKRLPVRKQIERTPQIAELEEAWGKNPRKDLEALSLRRNRGRIVALTDRMIAYKTNIHTHPVRPRSLYTFFCNVIS